MQIGFSKNQCLGDVFAAREILRPAVGERLDRDADLAGIHHGPADLVAAVVQRGVELLVALPASMQVHDANGRVCRDAAAVFADLGADAHDLEIHVHAIGDRLPGGVLRYQIFVEETEGLRNGSGGQPDDVRVEVLQHRAPFAVDRTMALVDHDQVEGLRWDRGVVL